MCVCKSVCTCMCVCVCCKTTLSLIFSAKLPEKLHATTIKGHVNRHAERELKVCMKSWRALTDYQDLHAIHSKRSVNKWPIER